MKTKITAIAAYDAVDHMKMKTVIIAASDTAAPYENEIKKQKTTITSSELFSLSVSFSCSAVCRFASQPFMTMPLEMDIFKVLLLFQQL